AEARPSLPPAASGIGQFNLMRKRLTLILRGTPPPSLTLAGVLGVGALALLLPVVPGFARPTEPARTDGPELPAAVMDVAEQAPDGLRPAPGGDQRPGAEQQVPITARQVPEGKKPVAGEPVRVAKGLANWGPKGLEKGW